MGRVLLAFRVFFAAIFHREAAARLQQALINEVPQLVAVPAPVSKPVEVAQPAPKKPLQSEAVTLLATLQREARLVDFFKEDLSGYSDEQVGAAVREIQRDCAAVLERFFSIQPILHDEEGASVNVPAGFDAARYRLTGKLTGEAPFHGTLQHHGWEATRCELPAFTGNESAARTIMPAEVEIR